MQVTETIAPLAKTNLFMKLLFSQKIVLLSMVFSFVALSLAAQQKYPQHYFRSPVNFPIYLSGTFGELRDGHFHSGIDIKTGGVRGKKVYAVANGYVSRIKISLTGYGKALYITHPNGYVSVYSHLEKFNSQLQRYVKAIQYKQEKFMVQIFPPKDSIRVKKGEVIAYSGNTGSALGPHLHFEIREGKSQYPVNPLLFGSIKITDNLTPKIVQLAVFPAFPGSRINHKPDTLIFPVAGHGKVSYLKNVPVIHVRGPVSFGLRTYDVMNGSHNENGVYTIQLYEDTLPVFTLRMNRISFSTTRYVNSLIDYNYFEKTGKRLVRTQVDTNNRIGNYRHVLNRGVFTFNDTLPHHFKYVVSDVYGNSAILKFTIQDAPAANPASKKINRQSGTFIRFNRSAQIDSGNISLSFPKNCFYRSFYFHLKQLPATNTTLSPVFAVHNRFVAAQKYFSLRITADSLAPSLKKKTYIAYAPDTKADYSWVGGTWNGNIIGVETRNLGDYTLMADTIPPFIKPVNFGNGAKVTGKHSLRVIIEDKQSGIKDYRPTLNGRWILMEYDVKTNTLTYHFDSMLKKGKNEFRLIVHDNVGNESVFKALIYN
ncbi:MAG: peptidase M23 [bacterium]|nr:MAG: peptidase M23 [bacterium]